MPAVKPENDLLSVGKLAELLQATPARIAIAADAAGVAPKFRLNGVGYFASEDVERIRERLGRASR